MASEYRTLSLSVETRVYPPNTLFLRETIASGTLGEQQVEVSVTIGQGCMLVRIGDEGDWYAFTPQGLIEAVSQARQEVAQ